MYCLWQYRQMDRQTDGQTDRWTDRLTDGQTDRWTDRQTDRETDKGGGQTVTLFVSCLFTTMANVSVLQDFSVCDSCIMCICAVNDNMWIGSEMGYVYIYGADDRRQLARVSLGKEKRDPVMCMIHSPKDRHVS